MTSFADTQDDKLLALTPDKKVSVRETFGIDVDMTVPAFSTRDSHVPDLDPSYKFDPETTRAICAGFAYDRRVMVQGYHGTGKSTHIEQVAARLNWPLIRVNLDSHVSRIDLVGKDAIVLKDGKQITEFREGILPWTIQRPIALVFDEYDAGRPDVMFVIQRVLEAQGKLTLLDQNRVIRPNPFFRLFSTTNTIGLGDTTGLYHGTQQINQGQMDRWSIVTTLNYLAHDAQQGAALRHARRQAHDRRHGPRGRHDPQRLHERRHLHGHEPADGDHLGPERRDLQRRPGPGLPDDLPEQVRRTGARHGGRILPARLRSGPAGIDGAGAGGLRTARLLSFRADDAQFLRRLPSFRK
jgi:cobaltochelatase CobS